MRCLKRKWNYPRSEATRDSNNYAPLNSNETNIVIIILLLVVNHGVNPKTSGLVLYPVYTG